MRLGPEHAAIATFYHNLGGLAHAQGQYAATEPLARRAVQIRERVLGPDHPAVAADRAALAPILHAIGNHDEAEQLLQQVLQTYLAVNDHYEIGVTLNNLAAIACRRNDLADAGTLFRNALAAKETALGTDHPELAPTLNNLGLVEQRHGTLPAARSCYERAIAILEHTVEPNHPTLFTEEGVRRAAAVAGAGRCGGDGGRGEGAGFGVDWPGRVVEVVHQERSGDRAG